MGVQVLSYPPYKKVKMSSELNLIRSYLADAHNIALRWQQSEFEANGDTPLFRKLKAYTVPGLAHWINGAQAGNVKDLTEHFERENKK